MHIGEASGPYQIMIKPLGPICDLACTYCYYLPVEKLYRKNDFRMSDELLEEFTRQFLLSGDAVEVEIAWHGGEPTLMGLEFFERAVYYQRKHAPPWMRIQNTLQTNGVGLNESWAQFFAENDFLIGISLDGPRQLHNVYRLDKGGNPTFDRVLAGLRLLQEHKVKLNILTAVHQANEDRPLEVYRFLRDEIKAEFIQFIPIVERLPYGESLEGRLVTEATVQPAQFGEFLIRIFDEWVRRDVGQVFIQIFDVTLGAWLGKQGGLCDFSPTCGNTPVLEHNGDIYTCDHFVDAAHFLGNMLKRPLIELITSRRLRDFGQAKWTALPSCCHRCEVVFACNGGCPKDRFEPSLYGQPSLNILCVGYRAFFMHVAPAMSYMANELRNRRPPANVMAWIDPAYGDDRDGYGTQQLPGTPQDRS
jgi:uncharacterized protein